MGLSKEQQLALNIRWLIQANERPIQMAAEAAYAVFWSRNVKEVFANNSAEDEPSRRPSSWSQMGTALGINPKHASRYGAEKDAKHGSLREKLTIPETLVRYRVAMVLGVKEDELSPTLRRWVAESAKWLVTLNRPHLGVRFSNPQFLTYADYLLADCDEPKPKQICAQGVAEAQLKAPVKDIDVIKDDILDVAMVIGDILAKDVGLELPE